jgi:hypothetical protein
LVAKSYSDEVTFDEEIPYGSVRDAWLAAVLLRPIKYFFLYFFLPFSASMVLCNRMGIKILMRLRANWKHYKQYKEITASNKSQKAVKAAKT